MLPTMPPSNAAMNAQIAPTVAPPIGLGAGDRHVQRGSDLVIRADVPVLSKEDIAVDIAYRSERSYGQFFRAIPLPDGVNAEQCDATFKDGVLEVALKAPQQREKSRQIPIR